MIRLLAIFIITLTTSCNASLYSYVTKQGLWVYDRTEAKVPKAKLEALVEKALPLLEGGADVTKYDYFLHGSLIPVPYKGKTIRTSSVLLIDKKQVHIAVLTDCLVMSSIIHEMVHLAHDPEKKHEDKELWKRTSLLEAELSKECSEEDIISEIRTRGPSFNEVKWE